MIPRIRPSYSVAELRAAWRARADAVSTFERQLAAHFGMQHALAFPYGRSAIFSCLQALRLSGEVVQPAYNCVVVAHATVLAGCRPVFVDTPPDDPNQDPSAMAGCVGADTVAAVPTSIFGVSFDAAALCAAIRRRNPKTFILMDCCQGFDARWRGDTMAAHGDAAVLAFGIGKPMTTLYGGALLTNRDDVAIAVRQQRAATLASWPRTARLRRWLYFLSSWLALSSAGVRLTDVLENADTPLHRYLLRLRSREAIRLPADNGAAMLPMQAAIGHMQLQRVAGFLSFSQLGIRHRLVDHGQHCPRLELKRGVIGCSRLFAIAAVRVVVAQIVIGVPLVRT